MTTHTFTVGARALAALAATAALTAPAAAVATDQPADDDPWIAFQWVGSGDRDRLFLVRTDGTDRHEILPDVDGNVVHPDWSGDGSRLAFVVDDGSAMNIWTSGADGSDATPLTDCSGSCYLYDMAAWSPDGDSVLTIRYDGPPTGTREIPAAAVVELVDAATGERRTIVELQFPELISYPRWSPDGRSYTVTLERYEDDGVLTGTAIAVGRIDSTVLEPLTDWDVWAAYSDWHPANDLIVYNTYDLGTFQASDQASNLYTVRPDGSEVHQLTTFEGGTTRAVQPRWTPDGTAVLFTRVDNPAHPDRSAQPRHMAIVSAHGTGLRWATPEPLAGTHPTMQPQLAATGPTTPRS